MSGLPSGWAKCRLGDFLSVKNGYAFKSKSFVSRTENTVSVIRISDIASKIATDNNSQHIAKSHALDGFETFTGDLLIAMSGATTGKVGIYRGGQPAYQNQRVGNIKALAPNLAYMQFRNHLISGLAGQILNDAYGGAQPNISSKAIEEIKVALPPLQEQKRIADKLNTVLTRVDACREHLDRVAIILKRFRQSVLAAGISGELKADWQDKEIQKQSWVIKPLSSLGVVSGGLTKNSKRDDLPTKRPYLRVANVYANELRLTEIREIGLTESEFKKTKLQCFDLLIVEGNGSIDQIGRVAMWQAEIADCSHQNHLIRWRANAQALPKFILFFLLSPDGRKK